VVPRLSGLTSVVAKRRLLAAHCALGKMSVARRYKRAKRLVVASQSAKAGTVLAACTQVAVTLKPPPPRHRKKRHR
jgi:beta-lactam-binding protein with PASTA domain